MKYAIVFFEHQSAWYVNCMKLATAKTMKEACKILKAYRHGKRWPESYDVVNNFEGTDINAEHVQPYQID